LSLARLSGSALKATRLSAEMQRVGSQYRLMVSAAIYSPILQVGSWAKHCSNDAMGMGVSCTHGCSLDCTQRMSAT